MMNKRFRPSSRRLDPQSDAQSTGGMGDKTDRFFPSSRSAYNEQQGKSGSASKSYRINSEAVRVSVSPSIAAKLRDGGPSGRKNSFGSDTAKSQSRLVLTQLLAKLGSVWKRPFQMPVTCQTLGIGQMPSGTILLASQQHKLLS